MPEFVVRFQVIPVPYRPSEYDDDDDVARQLQREKDAPPPVVECTFKGSHTPRELVQAMKMVENELHIEVASFIFNGSTVTGDAEWDLALHGHTATARQRLRARIRDLWSKVKHAVGGNDPSRRSAGLARAWEMAFNSGAYAMFTAHMVATITHSLTNPKLGLATRVRAAGVVANLAANEETLKKLLAPRCRFMERFRRAVFILQAQELPSGDEESKAHQAGGARGASEAGVLSMAKLDSADSASEADERDEDAVTARTKRSARDRVPGSAAGVLSPHGAMSETASLGASATARTKKTAEAADVADDHDPVIDGPKDGKTHVRPRDDPTFVVQLLDMLSTAMGTMAGIPAGRKVLLRSVNAFENLNALTGSGVTAALPGVRDRKMSLAAHDTYNATVVKAGKRMRGFLRTSDTRDEDTASVAGYSIVGDDDVHAIDGLKVVPPVLAGGPHRALAPVVSPYARTVALAALCSVVALSDGRGGDGEPDDDPELATDLSFTIDSATGAGAAGSGAPGPPEAVPAGFEVTPAAAAAAVALAPSMKAVPVMLPGAKSPVDLTPLGSRAQTPNIMRSGWNTPTVGRSRRASSLMLGLGEMAPGVHLSGMGGIAEDAKYGSDDDEDPAGAGAASGPGTAAASRPESAGGSHSGESETKRALGEHAAQLAQALEAGTLYSAREQLLRRRLDEAGGIAEMLGRPAVHGTDEDRVAVACILRWLITSTTRADLDAQRERAAKSMPVRGPGGSLRVEGTAGGRSGKAGAQQGKRMHGSDNDSDDIAAAAAARVGGMFGAAAATASGGDGRGRGAGRGSGAPTHSGGRGRGRGRGRGSGRGRGLAGGRGGGAEQPLGPGFRGDDPTRHEGAGHVTAHTEDTFVDSDLLAQHGVVTLVARLWEASGDALAYDSEFGEEYRHWQAEVEMLKAARRHSVAKEPDSGPERDDHDDKANTGQAAASRRPSGTGGDGDALPTNRSRTSSAAHSHHQMRARSRAQSQVGGEGDVVDADLASKLGIIDPDNVRLEEGPSRSRPRTPEPPKMKLVPGAVIARHASAALWSCCAAASWADSVVQTRVRAERLAARAAATRALKVPRGSTAHHVAQGFEATARPLMDALGDAPPAAVDAPGERPHRMSRFRNLHSRSSDVVRPNGQRRSSMASVRSGAALSPAAAEPGEVAGFGVHGSFQAALSASGSEADDNATGRGKAGSPGTPAASDAPSVGGGSDDDDGDVHPHDEMIDEYLPVFLEMADHKDLRVATAAVGALAHACSDDERCSEMIECGAHDRIAAVLSRVSAQRGGRAVMGLTSPIATAKGKPSPFSALKSPLGLGVTDGHAATALHAGGPTIGIGDEERDQDVRLSEACLSLFSQMARHVADDELAMLARSNATRTVQTAVRNGVRGMLGTYRTRAAFRAKRLEKLMKGRKAPSWRASGPGRSGKPAAKGSEGAAVRRQTHPRIAWLLLESDERQGAAWRMLQHGCSALQWLSCKKELQHTGLEPLDIAFEDRFDGFEDDANRGAGPGAAASAPKPRGSQTPAGDDISHVKKPFDVKALDLGGADAGLPADVLTDLLRLPDPRLLPHVLTMLWRQGGSAVVAITAVRHGAVELLIEWIETLAMMPPSDVPETYATDDPLEGTPAAATRATAAPAPSGARDDASPGPAKSRAVGKAKRQAQDEADMKKEHERMARIDRHAEQGGRLRELIELCGMNVCQLTELLVATLWRCVGTSLGAAIFFKEQGVELMAAMLRVRNGGRRGVYRRTQHLTMAMLWVAMCQFPRIGERLAELGVPITLNRIVKDPGRVTNARIVAAGLLEALSGGVADTQVSATGDASKMPKGARAEVSRQLEAFGTSLGDAMLSLIASPDPVAQHYGALMIAYASRTNAFKRLMAKLSGPQRLISLLRVSEHKNVVQSLLHALLNLSTDPSNQEILGRCGLTTLLDFALTRSYPEFQSFASKAVLNLRRHPGNRTHLYKAQLHYNERQVKFAKGKEDKLRRGRVAYKLVHMGRPSAEGSVVAGEGEPESQDAEHDPVAVVAAATAAAGRAGDDHASTTGGVHDDGPGVADPRANFLTWMQDIGANVKHKREVVRGLLKTNVEGLVAAAAATAGKGEGPGGRGPLLRRDTDGGVRVKVSRGKPGDAAVDKVLALVGGKRLKQQVKVDDKTGMLVPPTPDDSGLTTSLADDGNFWRAVLTDPDSASSSVSGSKQASRRASAASASVASPGRKNPGGKQRNAGAGGMGRSSTDAAGRDNNRFTNSPSAVLAAVREEQEREFREQATRLRTNPAGVGTFEGVTPALHQQLRGNLTSLWTPTRKVDARTGRKIVDLGDGSADQAFAAGADGGGEFGLSKAEKRRRRRARARDRALRKAKKERRQRRQQAAAVREERAKSRAGVDSRGSYGTFAVGGADRENAYGSVFITASMSGDGDDQRAKAAAARAASASASKRPSVSPITGTGRAGLASRSKQAVLTIEDSVDGSDSDGAGSVGSLDSERAARAAAAQASWEPSIYGFVGPSQKAVVSSTLTPAHFAQKHDGPLSPGFTPVHRRIRAGAGGQRSTGATTSSTSPSGTSPGQHKALSLLSPAAAKLSFDDMAEIATLSTRFGRAGGKVDLSAAARMAQELRDPTTAFESPTSKMVSHRAKYMSDEAVADMYKARAKAKQLTVVIAPTERHRIVFDAHASSSDSSSDSEGGGGSGDNEDDGHETGKPASPGAKKNTKQTKSKKKHHRDAGDSGTPERAHAASAEPGSDADDSAAGSKRKRRKHSFALPAPPALGQRNKRSKKSKQQRKAAFRVAARAAGSIFSTKVSAASKEAKARSIDPSQGGPLYGGGDSNLSPDEEDDIAQRKIEAKAAALAMFRDPAIAPEREDARRKVYGGALEQTNAVSAVGVLTGAQVVARDAAAVGVRDVSTAEMGKQRDRMLHQAVELGVHRLEDGRRDSSEAFHLPQTLLNVLPEEAMGIDPLKQMIKDVGSQKPPPPTTVKLCKFEHVDGSTVCLGLYKHYTLPDGRTLHFHMDDDLHEIVADEVAQPPQQPYELHEIFMSGLPPAPPPVWPTLLDLEDPTPVHLPSAPDPQFAETLPCENHGIPGCQCGATDLAAQRADVDELLVEVKQQPPPLHEDLAPPFVLENSAFQSRPMLNGDGFFDGEGGVGKAFNLDFRRMLGLKGFLLHLVSDHGYDDRLQHKGFKLMMRKHYPTLWNVFQHYSALGGLGLIDSGVADALEDTDGGSDEGSAAANARASAEAVTAANEAAKGEEAAATAAAAMGGGIAAHAADGVTMCVDSWIQLCHSLGLVNEMTAKFNEGFLVKLFTTFNLKDSDQLQPDMDRTMVRHEFLCMWVIMAGMRYLGRNARQGDNIITAVDDLTEKDLAPRVPVETLIQNDEFREHHLYSQRMEWLIDTNQSTLRRLYARSSHTKVGRGKAVGVHDWVALLARGNLFHEYFTKRDARLIFSRSKPRLADDLKHRQQNSVLQFPDFVEALARVALQVGVPTNSDMRKVGVGSIREFFRLNAVKPLAERRVSATPMAGGAAITRPLHVKLYRLMCVLCEPRSSVARGQPPNARDGGTYEDPSDASASGARAGAGQSSGGLKRKASVAQKHRASSKGGKRGHSSKGTGSGRKAKSAAGSDSGAATRASTAGDNADVKRGPGATKDRSGSEGTKQSGAASSSASSGDEDKPAPRVHVSAPVAAVAAGGDTSTDARRTAYKGADRQSGGDAAALSLAAASATITEGDEYE